ncbi:MAG: hypothetical protein CR217_06080 [Beijerinckiaceae bacterium]|nr:MAG: hypothetical protein CR217_06080 [Beijerinckiaceae bacterium]
MNDEQAALHWLLNGNDPLVTGPQPGRAALVSLLKGNLPLCFDIRQALARALEPVSVGEAKLTLIMAGRRGRGRPPLEGSIKGLVDDMLTIYGDRGASPDTVRRAKKRLHKALPHKY